jgi:hypothetical protein
MLSASITWSERQGLACCPCVGCGDYCDPDSYCVKRVAWLERMKIVMRKNLDILDLTSRSYIKAMRNR